MLQGARQIEQGGNGVVLRWDDRKGSNANKKLDDDDDSALEEILNAINREPEELVSKLLKVFEPQKAQKEFQKQKRARNIIEQAENEDAAKVPKCWFAEDVDLSEEEQDLISQFTGEKSERKGVILMDYVPGVDLGRFLFEKAAEEHQECDLEWKEIRDMSFEALIRRIIDTGLFENLQTYRDRSEKNRLENQITHPEIMKQLRNFLNNQQEAVIDPAVFEKIEQAIELLHQNNLFHNDLHERNIILKNPYDEQQETEPYLIDFGSASMGQPLNNANKDSTVLQRHKALTQTREVKGSQKRQEIERKQLREDITDGIERFENKHGEGSWRQKRNKIISELDANVQVGLYKVDQLPIKELKIDVLEKYIRNDSTDNKEGKLKQLESSNQIGIGIINEVKKLIK